MIGNRKSRLDGRKVPRVGKQLLLAPTTGSVIKERLTPIHKTVFPRVTPNTAVATSRHPVSK